VQHEVVAPAGGRDRVELDRPEHPEDLEHRVEASRERPRRREEVPCDEKATRRLSSDLHLEDTSRAGVDRPARTRLVRCEGRLRTMIHVMASHQIPAEGRVPLHALTAPRSSLARAPMGRAAPNEHSTAKFHGVNQDRTR